MVGREPMGHEMLVVGQVARDLVLAIDQMPQPQGSAAVSQRHEMLGGKGANQAVGLRQLGGRVALLGVVGADLVGEQLLAAARADELGTEAVRRRGTTALLLDLVDRAGTRRLIEHVPTETLLTAADVHAARSVIDRADTVCLQLQQPAGALTEAARIARTSGARIVLDGAADTARLRELLAQAWVVRADAHETELMTGIAPDDERSGLSAARGLLAQGARVAAVGVDGVGDLVAWAGGHRLLPFRTDRVRDTTGGGDAFLAGLVTGLRAGASPEAAGGLAADCSAATVQRLGGRPDLSLLRS